MESEPSNVQENNQQAEISMDVDENQQLNNKDTVGTGMMLDDNVATEKHADAEKEKGTENAGDGEETQNSQEDTTAKESKSVKNPEPAPEKVAEVGGKDGGDSAVPEQQGESDQKTPDSVGNEVGEDNGNVENKTDGLDVESMLAAIHNDNSPTNSRDTQSKA